MSLPRQSNRDYYDILGADVNTSSRDLERLYKRQAARCHPDKGGSEEAMKSLNEAYGVLKNVVTRREYDARRVQTRARRAATPASRPAAQDVGAFGRFLSAFMCLLVGLFLLFLVRFQWIWFLWPLAILAVFVIVFGLLMARAAVRASLPLKNPLQRHLFILETLFWMVVLGSGYGVYILLGAVE
jgi:hypothetical protein